MSHFNYIVTCHNSEALIERVLAGVELAGRTESSRVVCVLDGCTDNTEKIVDEHARWLENGRTTGTFPSVPLLKAHTTDVHELLAINAGLRAAPQGGDGYNIILQDDVILEDPDLERKVEALYDTLDNLGYVSFRLGFNIGSPDLTPHGYFEQVHEIESVYGAAACEEVLRLGAFAWRTVPIKSPVCLPCKLVRELGIFNEDLAPYGYDDLDYAIRATMAGYQNGVLSIPFRSDVRWGGTRRSGHPDVQPVVRRNAAYIAQKYRSELLTITKGEQYPRVEVIFPSTPEKNAAAVKRWNESRAVLREMNP